MLIRHSLVCLQRTNLTYYHLVVTLHETMATWKTKPSPDPDVRKVSTALQNPDAWDRAKFKKEMDANPHKVQRLRAQFQQQQAQKKFKDEVRGEMLRC